jgi:hypothetical protein
MWTSVSPWLLVHGGYIDTTHTAGSAAALAAVTIDNSVYRAGAYTRPLLSST